MEPVSDNEDTIAEEKEVSEPDTATQIRAAPEETKSSSTDEQDLEAERSNDEEHIQDTDDYDQGNAQEDETAAAQECEAEVARG